MDMWIHISRLESRIQFVGAMLVFWLGVIYEYEAVLLFNCGIYLYLRLIMRSDLIR